MVIQAVRMGVWLEGMQKQLQHTATALQKNPASVLASFQKILSRPTYFLVPSKSGDWILLFGSDAKRNSKTLLTRAVATATAPMEVIPAQGRVFDFVLPQPSFSARVLAFCRQTARALHQWLMHPLIDTRDPSEPAS